MFDPLDSDTMQFYQDVEKQLEQHQEKAIALGYTFDSLVNSDVYRQAKARLYETFIHRVPSVPSSSEGPLMAYGEVRFRQGLKYFFDYVERVVALKNRYVNDANTGSELPLMEDVGEV
ncbi:MAG: hypothetical protein KTR14_08115 [Vampirovibrio sp.]|nr:hypothetical protein [Vampirovibrio sp.]